MLTRVMDGGEMQQQQKYKHHIRPLQVDRTSYPHCSTRRYINAKKTTLQCIKCLALTNTCARTTRGSSNSFFISSSSSPPYHWSQYPYTIFTITVDQCIFSVDRYRGYSRPLIIRFLLGASCADGEIDSLEVYRFHARLA